MKTNLAGSDILYIAARGPLRGSLSLPGDKSISHRAALLASLAPGRSRLVNYSTGADCASTLSVLAALGTGVRHFLADGPTVEIAGGEWREPEDVLDCGNSGTTCRLLIGLLAGHPFSATLTGDASLRSRPMGRVVKPLGRMGARFLGRAGGERLPLTVSGGDLQGIAYESPVASAQVKSALLLAGLFAGGETRVTEPHLSRDHTERLLPFFGLPCDREGLTVTVRAGRPHPVELRIPGDISAAAFFLAAATLVPGSEVLLREVGINPTRTGILEVLEAMGARVELHPVPKEGPEPVADLLVRSAPLRAVEIGGSLIPRIIDEIPILAVLATQAEGRTVIRDAGELRVKETDRLAALARNLSRLGADVRETEDGLVITGPTPLRGGTVTSFDDHRIAMAMAVAALVATGRSRLEGAAAARISHPSFYDDLQNLGATVSPPPVHGGGW